MSKCCCERIAGEAGEKVVDKKEAILEILPELFEMPLEVSDETARLIRRTIWDLLRGPVTALEKVLKKCRSAGGAYDRGGEDASVRPAKFFSTFALARFMSPRSLEQIVRFVHFLYSFEKKTIFLN